MPITLGCPSCGKRFRARDESAGKRVKCPYCSAAVSVPTAEESAAAGAPTLDLTPPPSGASVKPAAPAKPAAAPKSAPKVAPGRPASVASPDDWGAGDAPQPPAPPAYAPPPPEPTGPAAFEVLPKPGRQPPPPKAPAARPAAARPAAASGTRTPEQLAAPGWKKTRAGLSWVMFGLFFLALPGFVGFAKVVCARGGVELPRGPGDDWISIEGYINSGQNAVRVSKEEILDLAVYGLPVFFGVLFLAFGRLTCGAAPRNSGAKGMFALSGVFTFVALAGFVTWFFCDKWLFEDTKRYARPAWMISAGVSEFWFLTGLAASGVALKRPKAARAVGLLGFFVALVVAAATIGWTVYEREFRPSLPTDDVRMYEQAAIMLGWLLVIGLYWRAVRSVRLAISEFLETAEEA